MRESAPACACFGSAAARFSNAAKAASPKIPWILRPGDIDAVIILPRGFDTDGDHARRIRALHQEHSLDIERIPESDAEELEYLLSEFFGHDREGRPRGLLEVEL